MVYSQANELWRYKTQSITGARYHVSLQPHQPHVSSHQENYENFRYAHEDTAFIYTIRVPHKILAWTCWNEALLLCTGIVNPEIRNHANECSNSVSCARQYSHRTYNSLLNDVHWHNFPTSMISDGFGVVPWKMRHKGWMIQEMAGIPEYLSWTLLRCYVETADYPWIISNPDLSLSAMRRTAHELQEGWSNICSTPERPPSSASAATQGP